MSYRRYLKRGMYLLLWGVVLFVFTAGFAGAAGVPLGRAANLLFNMLILLAIAIFSKPLGFWRKAGCIAAAAGVYILAQFILAQIMFRVFSFSLEAMLTLDYIALAAGIMALVAMQRRWRSRAPAIASEVA